MHILTVTTLFPNALQPVHGLFVKARMEAYARRFGHRWTVIAPVPWYPKLPFRTSAQYDAYARVPAREEAPGRVTYHPRYLQVPKLGMASHGARMARAVRALAGRVHAEHAVDVVDGHYLYPDGTAALAAGEAIGRPVVLSARGTDLHTFPSLPGIRPLLEGNLRACARLIAVSSDLARIARDLGMDPGRISVIGNGVDAARFRPQDRAASRRKLGAPEDGILLLCVGRLVEVKGFDLVLRALARLKGPPARAVFAGEGPLRASLEALAARLGLSDRVRFAGAVANDVLPDWYAAADVFVMASAREGWPNAPCEALACGTPVVGPRIPGMEDIVTDPGLGILYDRSEEGLAGALREALGRTWDRDAIAKAGGLRTWEHVSDQLEPIFRKAAEGGRVRGPERGA
jgi:glycosyltransferase involved in cell wall biosynthesis